MPLFFTNRTYAIFLAIVVWMVLTSSLPAVFLLIGQVALVLLIILLFVDGFLLMHSSKPVLCERKMGAVLSLGSENQVQLSVQNLCAFNAEISVTDHFPDQLQLRDVSTEMKLKSGESRKISTTIYPKTRGLYQFGNIYVFIKNRQLGLLQRKVVVDQKHEVKVYPSFIEMREIELKSMSKIAVIQSVKRLRRLGHSYEFEQIRAYVEGDDYRSINWKATGRRQGLMINQYEDQRAQPVYFALDIGRNMKMPFNGLSLIDYAINSTLAISNVAIKKGDKVGLITFDKVLKSLVKASDKKGQLFSITEALYHLKQTDIEPAYDVFYHNVGNFIKQRSLIFLFTNCNTLHSLARIKPALQKLNRLHLLVVIMFENTEISALTKDKPKTLEEIYEHTIAEGFLYEQQQIALDLNISGIQTIIADPMKLSIETVNKYLELKSQGKS